MKEMPFNQEKEEKSLQALGLQHFYLPLLFLAVGLVLSSLAFIAEIIIRPGGERETETV